MTEIGTTRSHARRPWTIIALLACLVMSPTLFSCQEDNLEELGAVNHHRQAEWEKVKPNHSEASPEVRQLSLLFIGSSFGVNTCIQFPFLAKHYGIDITCAIMFKGSAPIKFYADACENDTLIVTNIFNNDGRYRISKKTIDDMLEMQDWDIVVIQRGANEAAIWEEEQSEAMKRLVRYIRDHTVNNPTILFNATQAKSVAFFSGKRQEQIDHTKQCMVTSMMVSRVSGLEVIPSAIATQNARNTCLAQYGCFAYKVPDLSMDKSHLDIGIGSYVLGALMFETIIKPLFGISIEGNEYMPTAKELATIGMWKEDKYTSAEGIEDYFTIANEAAMSAARSGWELNKEMPFKYAMPGATPQEWDLDIDYSKAYEYEYDKDYDVVEPIVDGMKEIVMAP